MTNDEDRGLYEKYEVRRVDGSSEPGGKHWRCRYYVLDVDHDQFAIDALLAYAMACEEKFPRLAEDLFKIAKEVQDANK